MVGPYQKSKTYIYVAPCGAAISKRCLPDVEFVISLTTSGKGCNVFVVVLASRLLFVDNNWAHFNAGPFIAKGLLAPK